MQDTWLYDEGTQVGTDYLAEENVRKYDQKMRRLRDIPREVAAAAEALMLDEESTVWEIGTGTGEMALGLAAHCAKVWATDTSETMLAVARQKASQRGQANVEFGLGGFLKGFGPERPVDAVVSQLALHHLPDFWKLIALRRVASHLVPGGRFYLRDVVFPGDVDDYEGFFSRVIKGLREQGGAEVAQETILHIRDEYSTFDWALEEMLGRAGFRIAGKEVDGFIYVCTCLKS
ncbi:MAG: class I SAM-dependent methyltransferase [Dehalococcoidales bacterium]|nr:class I SAM-dependent methyltransferase [Dehalococcoidales bacterium]